MGYWNEFKEEFLEISKKNLHKMQEAGEALFDKAKKGGEILLHKTREEIEIILEKQKLHKARVNLTNTLIGLGDGFLDLYHKENFEVKDENLLKKISLAMDQEQVCKEIEKNLKDKHVNLDLKETATEIFTETTPY